MENEINKIKTFSDLLKFNIKFLQGDIPSSFTHLGKPNEETNFILSDLLSLNKSGIYTTQSQPFIYNNMYKQIPYVNAIIEKKRFVLSTFIQMCENNNLLYEVLVNNKIYSNIIYDDNKLAIVLTRKRLEKRFVEYTFHNKPYNCDDFDFTIESHKERGCHLIKKKQMLCLFLTTKTFENINIFKLLCNYVQSIV